MCVTVHVQSSKTELWFQKGVPSLSFNRSLCFVAFIECSCNYLQKSRLEEHDKQLIKKAKQNKTKKNWPVTLVHFPTRFLRKCNRTHIIALGTFSWEVSQSITWYKVTCQAGPVQKDTWAQCRPLECGSFIYHAHSGSVSTETRIFKSLISLSGRRR